MIGRDGLLYLLPIEVESCRQSMSESMCVIALAPTDDLFLAPGFGKLQPV